MTKRRQRETLPSLELPYPRALDHSAELAEVRTVLSRARTALAALERLGGYSDPDPDVKAMISAMAYVVGKLDRWRGHRKSRAERWRA